MSRINQKNKTTIATANKIIRNLDELGDLASADHGLGESDVIAIFGLITEALYHTRAQFGFSPSAGNLKISLDDPSSDNRWKAAYARILERRFEANLELRGIGKLHYSDEGADLLAASVAQVLQMRTVPGHTRPRSWVDSNPGDVVFLDTRVVVRQMSKGERQPGYSVAAITGRLKSMAAYAPEVSRIGVSSLSRSALSRHGYTADDAGHVVALYHSPTALR